MARQDGIATTTKQAEARCQHCFALIEKDGKQYCDEADCPVDEVRDCREWQNEGDNTMPEQVMVKESAKSILAWTEALRDTFPDDLPYLWQQLSPAIEGIERSAHAIIREAA